LICFHFFILLGFNGKSRGVKASQKLIGAEGVVKVVEGGVARNGSES
jgi:hypothetical protein